MSKIINVSFDLNMISEHKKKNHANGACYVNLTVCEKKEPDNYGNTHYLVEAQTKEERAAGAPKNYLRSSGKEFVFGGGGGGQAQQQQGNVANQQDDDDDLPF